MGFVNCIFIQYFCMQLTKTHVAETTCNQLSIQLQAHQDQISSYHNLAMSLYDIILA